MKSDPLLPAYDPNRPVGEIIREELRTRRDVDPIVREKLGQVRQARDATFEQIANEIRGNRRSAALSFVANEDRAPAEASEIAGLSRRFGLSSDIVAADPTIWRQRAKREDVAAASAISTKLPQWTAKEKVRAAIITDDLDNMLRVEQALSPELRASLKKRAAQRQQIQSVLADPNKATEGGNFFSSIFSLLGADTLSSEQESSTFGGGVRSIGGGIVNTADIIFNSAAAQLADAFGAITGSESAKADALALSKTNENISILQAARRPEYSEFGGMVYDGFNSLALMAPGIAASIATRSERPALAAAYVLTQPEAYTRYRARGGSAGEAFFGSTLEGITEVAFEKLPLSTLVNRFGKEATGKWIGEYLIKEGLTEQATTFTQDFIDTAIANPDKTWGEFWGERPEAALRTLVATGVASGTIGAMNTTVNKIGGRMAQRQSRADSGMATAMFAEDLQKLAQASKVRGRDVATFENWVREASDGTEAEAVYIEAQKLVEVLEQSGLDEQQIVEALPSLQETLGEAMATNGDVRIPIEEFAARAEKLAPGLIPHLRIDPDDMSQAEADTYMQSAQESMKAEAEEIFSKADSEDEFRASAERVKASVKEQLDTAARFTSATNDAYASLHANFFARLAQRAGTTPEEMAARYPLQVQADVGQGVNVLEQADDATVVNIGLKIDATGETMPTERAVAALEAAGVKLTRQEVRQSNTESTLVAQLDRPLTPEEATKVSEALMQDAIAQRVGQAGELFGPKADEWGPFNPEFFLDLAESDVLNQGARTELNAPPVDTEGYIELQHWSPDDDLATLDPSRWGRSGRFLPPEEYERTNRAPGRTYFGIATGQPGGYRNEFAEGKAGAARGPRYEYRARIKADRLYDMNADPLDLKAKGRALPKNEYGRYVYEGKPGGLDGVSLYEQLIKDAGFDGYWIKNGSLGLVAAVFVPTQAERSTYNQDAPIFYRGTTRDETPGRFKWFSSKRSTAEAYGSVKEYRVRLINPLVVDADSQGWDQLVFEGESVDAEDLARIAKRRGHDGVIVQQVNDNPNDSWDFSNVVVSFYDDRVTQAERSTYNQDAPIFYSALARAVSTSKQAKAKASQWKGILQNAPGVKAEELEWSGLLDALDFDPERVMTREELADVVDKGGIVVDEVVLRGRNDFITPQEIDEKADQLHAMHIDWLVGDQDVDPDQARTIADGMYGEFQRQAESDLEAEPVQNEVQFATWSSDPENGTYRELLMTLPIGSGGNPDRAPSTHWDQPNVVAHVRFMEKKDADGRRVLFIEEVQSDWHQKGRDQGYETKVDPETVAAAQAKADALREDLVKAQAVYDDTILNAIFNDERDAKLEAARITLRAAAEAFNLAGRELDVAKGLITNGGVPNAPFKSTWPALVMKRAIRWAVDNAYDKVAWTTGAQQADRYSLAQTVGRMTVAREGNDYRVTTPDNYRVTETLLEQGIARRPESAARSGAVMDAAQLKEAFGENIAQQIVGGATELSGDDLKIGGEGMKAFYDRNLVNITNSLIKKYGAKVGAVGVRETNGKSADARREIETEIQQRLGLVGYGITSRAEAEARAAEFEAQAEAGQGDPAKAREWARNLRVSMELFDLLEAVPTTETQPGFDITPELATAASHGFPLFQRTGAPRGQISFGTDIKASPTTITLLRGADLSTFLHESGHFFLEVMADMAKLPDAPQEIVDDLNIFLRWSGVKDFTAWRQMSTQEKRDHHERFARAFEAYLWEGRAPSIEMHSLFGRFRSWLKNVYASLANLNVEMTDEVRGVFDRMLASETQVQEAQAMAGMEPVYTAKPDTMTDDEWAAYQAAHMDATRDAAEELERRSLRDMRYAGNAAGRELKRLQKEVKAQRDAMRDEVVTEMSALPVYRAERYLRKGELDGQPATEQVKLQSADLARRYEGKPELLEVAKRKLGGGKSGMLAKDGMTLDEAAEAFGFTSGDHFLDAYLGAQKFADAVETEIDARMVERYGDLNSPEALRAAVDKAIHNDVRGRFVATEYAMLAQAPGKPRALAAAARKVAQGVVARLRVRDVRPAQHEAAERRSGKAAADSAKKGNIAEAAAHKRSQLVSFFTAKAARDALDEVDKTLRYFRKFANEGTRKALDPAYRDQIDALLERFDLRASVTAKDAAKRASLLQWVERQREMGIEPVISEDLLNEARRLPYKELTIEQMRGLADAIRNIEHIARLKKKLLTAKDEREFADIVDEVANGIADKAFKKVPETIGAKSWAERVSNGVKDFFAMHRKMANMAHVMDGNEYGGPVWERFIRAMNERGDWQATQNEKATVDLGKLFDRLTGQDTTSREFVPEINASISLEDRLMVALNLGNEANAQRLMDGDKWEQPQLNAVLAPLTQEHWDFVQATWDYIDSFWPEIAAKELRVSGLAPEKVEAAPFERQLADGTMVQMRGGYFPIKYDPDRSTKAEADTAAEVLSQMTRGLYTAASTRRGHTKARAEKVERPVRKDFGVIFEHVNQVVHDLAWHEYLIDANRLLRAAPIDAAIREGYGPETLRWMRKALEDIAVGDIAAQNSFERAVNHLRAGVSVAGLGWNLWTSLLQPIGLTQSTARIGSKWVMRGVVRLAGDAAKLENGAAWVYERSEMMRLRDKTSQREINEIRNQITDKSPLRKSVDKVIPAPVSQAVADSFFVMIAKAQMLADLPAWIGQYEKSMEAGETEERAASIADQAVLDSQGGGQIKDLSGIQRGSPLIKLWTNFYSYFNVTYNLLSDRTAQAKRIGPADLPYYAVDVFLLTALPSMLATIMYTALKGNDDDWKLENLVKNIAKDGANYGLGLMIGLREIGGALTGDAGYRGPAGARFFAEVSNVGKQVEQGDIDEALLRSINNTAGILLHYPSGQIDRTVRGTQAMAEGEAGPLAPVVGPPRK